MPQEDLDLATFDAVLATFPDLAHVELQGEGESLLHPRFHEMVAALRARGVRVSFITNGSLLSEAHVARLLDAGIEKISVSIESPDEEAFREIRGGKLSKVLRNLEHLVAEKRRRGLTTPIVGLSITVLRRTRDDLPALLDLYRRLGLDGGITLQPLQRMEAYTAHYDDAVQAEHLDATEVEALWLSFFANPEVRRLRGERRATKGFYEELEGDWRPALGTCPYLERGLYVDRRGRVTPCCMVKDHEAHGLGTVGVDDRDTIVARRRGLAEELRAGRIPTACTGCEIARFATMSRWGLVRFAAKGLWQRVAGR
jgi:MoaA/NifB/PqqE/SkfB family radical SAM enzyme